MRNLKRVVSALMATAALGLAVGSAMAQDGAKIFVVGGKPDDPFWSIVKRGAEDAGKVVEAQGGSVTWLGPQNYDNLGPDAAELIRQAIDQKADAIVGPDWVPEAMDPAFKAVVDAGIPLVIYNAGGIEAADRLGAMNYVGAVDYKSGYAGGEYLGKAGKKKGVCVNTLPGAANIEAFCRGFKDGITALAVPARPPASRYRLRRRHRRGAGREHPSAAEPRHQRGVRHRRRRHQCHVSGFSRPARPVRFSCAA